MAKKFLLIIVLCIGYYSSAQIITIPDANFKNALIYNGFDTNSDGNIEVSEVQYATSLYLTNFNIQSLEGIQYFINLQQLTMRGNQVTSLAQLSSVSTLTTIDCGYNNLTTASFTGLNLIHVTNLKCDYNQIEDLSTIVSGFPNVYTVNCSHNQLTTFSPLASLVQLRQLTCGANLNTSFSSVSSLVNLTTIDVSSSNLTALDDLFGLVNLTELGCSLNNLTTVPSNHWPNLHILFCDSNPIQSLDLSGFHQLVNIYCANDLLTALDVGLNTTLTQLNCSFNHITTLDVSHQNMYTLNCDHNELTTLNIKNGRSETNISFANNPNLEYICADDSQIADIQTKITQYGYSNCHVNSYCSFVPGGTFFTIQGNVRYDENANGCDAADINYPNLRLNFTGGPGNSSFIADATGAYHYDVPAGSYSFSPVIENPVYFTISPTVYTASFPSNLSPLVRDFCVSANGTHNDLEVTLLPITRARPGFDAVYKIIYKNKGTASQNGTVTLAFDDSKMDLVSANPLNTGSSINNLSWSFSNLMPFESREITVTMNINTPTETSAVNGGDSLSYTTSITGLTDETPSDNSFTCAQIVVNSLDPNDKTCAEGTIVSTETIGQYVHYIIRFENTGSANAENIVVKDMIDTAKYDISSLIPLSGSASYVTRITNTNQAEFIFENINLPFDDAHNDGYVAFKIKTKPTLVVGDSFSNSASIYFDYNSPIVTNTATTTIQTLATQDFDFGNYFTVYPNPAKSVLNFETKAEIGVKSINIYNVLGQMVMAVINAENVSVIDVSNLNTGTYFIKVNTDKGTANTKFIKE